MKRLTAFLLIFAMLFSAAAITAFAEGEETYQPDLTITLKINTEWQEYVDDCILKTMKRADYQILAPARPFMEELEAEIAWDGDKQQVICTKGDTTIVFTIDSMTALVNGEEIELITPAELVDGTSYLPVEICGEYFNYHVLEQDYGRTIRLVQKTIDTCPVWEGDLKPGMAELASTVHRPIPTEFEKSNRLDDLLYFDEDLEYVPEEELTDTGKLDLSNLPTGEVIYTMDDLLGSIEPHNGACGRWEGVELNDDPDFDKALEIQCWYPPTNTVDWICKPEKRMEPYVNKDDKYIIKFWARNLTGGNIDTGRATMFFHCEESANRTWIKSVSETIEFGLDGWEPFVFLATGVENANHFGFTCGFYVQKIQVAGFEVQKLPQGADTSMLEKRTMQDLQRPQYAKEAPWRAEALERIENMRKGDFKVLVKDKNGNPVPNADVKFDMFEHEFEIGVALDGDFWNPVNGGVIQENVDSIAELCNLAGAGNALKADAFEANPQMARRIFDDCKNLGIKYFRGHAIWMPTLTDGNGDRPYHLFGPEKAANMDWDTFKDYLKEHINRIVALYPEIIEWDVSNEMVNRVTYDKFGHEYLMEIYKWAAEVFPKGMELAMCDNQTDIQKLWDKLDMFQKEGDLFTIFALQGHGTHPGENYPVSDYANTFRPTQRLLYYDRFAYEYGLEFSISEFSARADEEDYQADIIRDQLIAAFSHPACKGITAFWLSDAYAAINGRNYGPSPFYGLNYEKKLGWYQWTDLFYNKWWTRNATTVTDAEGRGQVRGFYGDYDVTVSIGGQEVKAVMAAFHKGYENELTITLDI